jgi:hypothetical protein
MIKGRPCKGIYAAIDKTITPFMEASRAWMSDDEPIVVDHFQGFRARKT